MIKGKTFNNFTVSLIIEESKNSKFLRDNVLIINWLIQGSRTLDN